MKKKIEEYSNSVFGGACKSANFLTSKLKELGTEVKEYQEKYTLYPIAPIALYLIATITLISFRANTDLFDPMRKKNIVREDFPRRFLSDSDEQNRRIYKLYLINSINSIGIAAFPDFYDQTPIKGKWSAHGISLTEDNFIEQMFEGFSNPLSGQLFHDIDYKAFEFELKSRTYRDNRIYFKAYCLDSNADFLDLMRCVSIKDSILWFNGIASISKLRFFDTVGSFELQIKFSLSYNSEKNNLVGTIILGNLINTENPIVINFDLEITQSHENQTRSKCFYFFLLILPISYFSLKSTTNLLLKVTDNSGFGQSISILSVTVISIWCYICSTFNLMATHSFDDQSLYIYYLPSIFYFFNYSICIFKLLIKLIEISNPGIHSNDLKCEIKRFYLKLCFIILIIIVFFNQILSNSIVITCIVFLLWVPQIVRNMRTNNKIALPIFTVFIESVSRLSLYYYCYGFNQNIFGFSTHPYFVGSLIIIVILQILWLYTQSIFGPNWCLPLKFQKEGHIYITPDQVKNIEVFSNEDICIICFAQFIEQIDEGPNQLSISKANLFSKTPDKIKFAWFNFHKFNFNLEKKVLIQLECKHIFHTNCIERWLEQRKECPSCKSVCRVI